MALVVCCPCGNPLDCDHLELVVSLTCPRCQREVVLEVTADPHPSALAILTVTEGPYWVGQQFVVPVDQDLLIGRAHGNWLALDSSAMSDAHCRLRLLPNGTANIIDLKSRSGTWVGSQRVTHANLTPQQSFCAGGFRFRLDLQSADGTTTIGLPPPGFANSSSSGLSVTAAKQDKPTRAWLVSNRYVFSRWGVLLFGCLSGVYHAARLVAPAEPTIPWPAAILVGLAIAGIFAGSARRIALTDKHFKYAIVGILLLLAMADLAGQLPLAAVAAIGLAASLLFVMLSIASESAVVPAAFVGAGSLTLMLILAIASLIRLAIVS